MNERDITPLVSGVPQLTETARALYLHLLGGGEATAETPGIRELVTLTMAVPTILNPDRYTAMSPRHIERAVRLRELNQIAGSVEALRALPGFLAGLESDLRAMQAGASTAAHASELIVGALIDSTLEELVHEARHEICTAMPGGPRPSIVGKPLESRELAAMQRGVRWRTLYSKQAKDAGGAPDFARTVTAMGQEVRTTPLPFQRTLLFDDTVALLPSLEAYTPEGQPRAWLVRDRGAIEFARRQFESAWEFATPWSFASKDGEITSPAQRQILRALLNGKPQKSIATMLGFSAGWVSQQLNELMKRLSLETQPQLIQWWLESEERHLM